jgi:hypothetical protein
MNTTLGTGDLQLSEGFLAWHKWVSENPDLGAGRLAASEVVSAWDSTINNLMTIALPLAMFEEMQCNLAGSFLERPTWQSLVKNK